MRPERASDPPLRHGALPGRGRRRGGPFAFTDVGEGPVVVAIHGLPGRARDFRWLGTALEPHLRLVRLEMPGFGETPLSTAPGATFEARARFVLEATRSLGIERFVALGHSMGGCLALELGARSPERVLGVALLASPGLRPHRLVRRSFIPGRAAARLFSQPPGSWMALPFIRESMKGAGFPRSTPDRAILHTLRLMPELDFPRMRENARALRQPAFVAWAEDDRLVEPGIGAELAHALPEGPRLAFESGGHNLQKTRATELAAALHEWVRGLSLPP